MAVNSPLLYCLKGSEIPCFCENMHRKGNSFWEQESSRNYCVSELQPVQCVQISILEKKTYTGLYTHSSFRCAQLVQIDRPSHFNFLPAIFMYNAIMIRQKNAYLCKRCRPQAFYAVLCRHLAPPRHRSYRMLGMCSKHEEGEFTFRRSLKVKQPSHRRRHAGKRGMCAEL